MANTQDSIALAREAMAAMQRAERQLAAAAVAIQEARAKINALRTATGEKTC